MNCNCLTSKESTSNNWMISLTQWRNPSHRDFDYTSESFTKWDSCCLVGRIATKLIVAEFGYALITIMATIETISFPIFLIYNLIFNRPNLTATQRRFSLSFNALKMSCSYLKRNLNPNPIRTSWSPSLTMDTSNKEPPEAIPSTNLTLNYGTRELQISDTSNRAIPIILIINMLGCFQLFAGRDSGLLDLLKSNCHNLKVFVIAKIIYHFAFGRFKKIEPGKLFSQKTREFILSSRSKKTEESSNSQEANFFKNRDALNDFLSNHQDRDSVGESNNVNSAIAAACNELEPQTCWFFSDYWEAAYNELAIADGERTITNLNGEIFQTEIDY